MNNNISLIGFASSGKTAVGAMAAQTLKFNFLDLDREIEALLLSETGVGLTCRDIYIKLGKETFLDLETRSLERISSLSKNVLATGGGAPMTDSNRGILKEFGKVIYLYAPPEVISERMKAKGLPAYLSDDPSLDNLRKYWEQRHPVYFTLANIIIDTTNKDIQSVVEEVVDKYEQHIRHTI